MFTFQSVSPFIFYKEVFKIVRFLPQALTDFMQLSVLKMTSVER